MDGINEIVLRSIVGVLVFSFSLSLHSFACVLAFERSERLRENRFPAPLLSARPARLDLLISGGRIAPLRLSQLDGIAERRNKLPTRTRAAFAFSFPRSRALSLLPALIYHGRIFLFCSLGANSIADALRGARHVRLKHVTFISRELNKWSWMRLCNLLILGCYWCVFSFAASCRARRTNVGSELASGAVRLIDCTIKRNTALPFVLFS